MKKPRTPYDLIKKQNGEAFARAVRNYDAGIFDVPNIVNIIRYAGREATEPLLRYLSSLNSVRIEEHGPYEDPLILLKKAGYDAFYVDSLEKQNSIKKYFVPGEELCTFRDPMRFERYYVVHAVREDADLLNRDDFLGKESRQDAYGTSVISIQIAKEGGRISIKNRYNHTVVNCDSTFNNNPDNIYVGLSAALKQRFNVDFSVSNVDVPEGFFLMDNQLFRYNLECDDIYFGPDFFVRRGIIYDLDKSDEIVMDDYILNTKDRTLMSPLCDDLYVSIDDEKSCGDAFMDALRGEMRGKKIHTTKNPDGSHNIMADDIPIVTVRSGNIIKLNLPTTTVIGDYFLVNDRTVEEFTAPMTQRIGRGFFFYNNVMKHLRFDYLQEVGEEFMPKNNSLLSFDARSVHTIKQFFLSANETLQKANLPAVKNIPIFFLGSNMHLRVLNMSSLVEAPDGFLSSNEDLLSADFSSLVKTGNDFCGRNTAMLSCRFPSLRETGAYFFDQNKRMKKIFAPNLKNIDAGFLPHNFTYKIYAPALVGKIPPERICLIAGEYKDDPPENFEVKPLLPPVRRPPLWAPMFRDDEKGM